MERLRRNVVVDSLVQQRVSQSSGESAPVASSSPARPSAPVVRNHRSGPAAPSGVDSLAGTRRSAPASRVSSSQTLEVLAARDKPSHVAYGLGRLAGGTALGAVTSVVVAGGAAPMIDMVAAGFQRSLAEGMLNGAIGLVGTALAAVGVYYTGSLGWRGLASPAEPFMPQTRDGRFFYRDGGYVAEHSSLDRKHGVEVFPIDDVRQLDNKQNQHVLVGDYFVNSASVKEQTRIRMETRSSGAWIDGKYVSTTHQVPVAYVEYTVTLKGTVGGKPLTVFDVNEDGDFSHQLAAQEGQRVYIHGTAGLRCVNGIERYGAA